MKIPGGGLGKNGRIANLAVMQNKALAEARWILGVLVALWLIALALMPLLCIPLAAAVLFTFWFFRDPERALPGDARLAVSPADGVVTTIDEVEEDEFLNTRMRRIGIFLSVFDVHVNRAPIAGEVTHSEPKPGLFLDARDPKSSFLNQSRSWVIQGEKSTVLVKQITGAIARRICPWAVVGDRLERGQRFGMIRFGSRTEVFLPMEAEILVQTGDRVRGGESPVARMP